MTNTTDVEVYIQLKPEWFAGSYGTPRVRSVKAAKMTARYPRQPQPGTVVAKFVLRVSHGAFAPLMPTEVVELPAEPAYIDVIPGEVDE